MSQLREEFEKAFKDDFASLSEQEAQPLKDAAVFGAKWAFEKSAKEAGKQSDPTGVKSDWYGNISKAIRHLAKSLEE